MPHAQSAVHTAHRWLSLKGRATCGPFDRDSTVYHGRPRASRSPRVSRDAACTRITATGCKRTPCGAVTSIRSHDVQIGTARTRHWRRLSRSEAEQPPLRRHIPCASQKETHGLQAHQSARIGRQRPPCAKSRVHASLGAIRNLPDTAIPFGAHSRSIPRWTGQVGCDG